MKTILIFIFSIITLLNCIAQNSLEFKYNNFENQFLNYVPIQNPKVLNKDFDYANMIIRETKSAVKNDAKNFNIADYFNILSAFLTLKESKRNIEIAFLKFKNADGSCEYVLSFENSINNNSKFDIIRADYLEKLKECKQKPINKKEFNIEEYCKSNTLDLALVMKINQVKVDDQKYRNKLSKKLNNEQQILDKKNQEIINSLYSKYNTYLGKTLVGEEFQTVMWAVIQHSNTEMMAKYLPIIQKAVEEKEIDIIPFKMLIDRFYGLKYGYQVFGSQSGFGLKLADDKKRKEIELKYGIK